jgi:hypothetical protein
MKPSVGQKTPPASPPAGIAGLISSISAGATIRASSSPAAFWMICAARRAPSCASSLARKRYPHGR